MIQKTPHNRLSRVPSRPSPQDIAPLLASIQAQWSPSQRRQRSVRGPHYGDPRLQAQVKFLRFLAEQK